MSAALPLRAAGAARRGSRAPTPRAALALHQQRRALAHVAAALRAGASCTWAGPAGPWRRATAAPQVRRLATRRSPVLAAGGQWSLIGHHFASAGAGDTEAGDSTGLMAKDAFTSPETFALPIQVGRGARWQRPA